jgi:hypothetical protein
MVETILRTMNLAINRSSAFNNDRGELTIPHELIIQCFYDVQKLISKKGCFSSTEMIAVRGSLPAWIQPNSFSKF